MPPSYLPPDEGEVFDRVVGSADCEKGLFVNRAFTDTIGGLQRHQSDALLELLWRHAEQPQFGYRHRWRTGDVLFWDNRITQHMVVADYWPQRRRMHRATILGDRPA